MYRSGHNHPNTKHLQLRVHRQFDCTNVAQRIANKQVLAHQHAMIPDEEICENIQSSFLHGYLILHEKKTMLA